MTAVSGNPTHGLQILTNIYSPNLEQPSAIKDLALSRFLLKSTTYCLDFSGISLGHINANC